MRWLVAAPGPQFSVLDVYAGWVEALRELGEHVVEFNLAERLAFYDAALLPTDTPDLFRKALSADQATELAVNGIYAALYKVRPDVLLIVSGFYLPPEVYQRARLVGTRIVLVHTEEPYEHDRDLARAPFADINLLNDPTHIEAFAELAPSYYVPHAYRPSIHHPGEADPAMVCDLAFVGTGYASRVEFFEAMDLDGLTVTLAGNWSHLDDTSPLRAYIGHDPAQCLDNDDTAALYRSARCGINLYRRESQRPEWAQGMALGPREVEMAACGLFFVRDPRGEGDQVLGMLPTFAGPEDAAEIIGWYLGHDDERTALAAKAREAIEDRTFFNNASALLRLLEVKE